MIILFCASHRSAQREGFVEKIETNGLEWRAALLITALITAVSILLAKGLTGLGRSPAGSMTLLPCSARQTIEPLGDGVVYGDATHLHALNASGRQKWNYMVGADFNFDAGEDGVAAWVGSSIALLDAETGASLFSGVLDERVISATMGANYAAALIGEDEQNSTLIVMEHDGGEIDRISLPNLTVLEYGFFNNGNMLWIMSLDTEGTVPMSQLTTYRPGRMLSGKITDSDQVLYEVMFESPNMYTIGTTYAKVYDYTGVEDATRRMLVYGWYLMDTGGSGSEALMAFVPMAQVGTHVSVSDVRLISGDADRTIRMPFPCHSLQIRNGKVYGFSDQYVMSCGIGDAKPSVVQLPVYCDDMLGITMNNEAIIVSGDSVYLVTLP